MLVFLCYVKQLLCNLNSCDCILPVAVCLNLVGPLLRYDTAANKNDEVVANALCLKEINKVLLYVWLT